MAEKERVWEASDVGFPAIIGPSDDECQAGLRQRVHDMKMRIGAFLVLIGVHPFLSVFQYFFD